MKNKILGSSLLSLMLTASVAFAQTPSVGSATPTTPPPSPSSLTQVVPGQSNSQCVFKAIDKRNTAFKVAGDAKQKALSDARTARDSALAVAKQLTDKSARAAARKAARDAYQTARKAAMDTYRSARQAAKDQFTADRKVCRTAQHDHTSSSTHQ